MNGILGQLAKIQNFPYRFKRHFCLKNTFTRLCLIDIGDGEGNCIIDMIRIVSNKSKL